MSERLASGERDRLLRLARAAIADRIHHDGSLERELGRGEPTAALRIERGAFVSLKQPAPNGGSALRGCIGSIEPRGPLFRTVIDVARRSAFEDPRFTPLAADELTVVRIEISALTSMRSVAGPEAIEVGRHGVQLRRAAASAVFLPQVAGEYGWDRETLLSQLSRKAGLAANAWRDAELSVFEAEVFGEPAPG